MVMVGVAGTSSSVIVAMPWALPIVALEAFDKNRQVHISNALRKY
jgi:hypothetical protein